MRSTISFAALLVLLTASPWAAPVALGQNPEYDFYDSYRNWAYELLIHDHMSVEEVLKRYREKLAAEGVHVQEIDRRIQLIRHERTKLEIDDWNRFFTADKPQFNTAPNALLQKVVQDLKPGRALDVGMGEGRNALYLAGNGWSVTGFDFADKAIEIARRRADRSGLKIDMVVANDRLRDSFGGLRTIQYERVREAGTDWFKDAEVSVVRFVAQKD